MAATTIPSQTTGSASIQARFIQMQAGIGPDIYHYNKQRSAFSNILETGSFPKEQGDTLRTMVYGRSRVNTSSGRPTWSSHTQYGLSSDSAGISPPDISTSRGLPPVSVVKMNGWLQECSPTWAALESELIDVRNEVFSPYAMQQFEAQYRGLLYEGSNAWDEKQEELYFKNCGKKVIVGVPESGSFNTLADLSVVAPQDFSGMTGYTLAQLNATGAAPSGGASSNHSVLTGGVLENIYAQLLRAYGNDQRLKGDGYMKFPLLTSYEQSMFLHKEPGTREDLRNGDPGALLKPLGVGKTLKGFSHIINPRPRRFTLALNGSTYDFTEVNPYSGSTGNISTTISVGATAASGTQTRLTVASTAGIIADQQVRIAPTSDDADYSGTWTVTSVDSANSYVYINKAFTSTLTGVLYTQSLGRGYDILNTSYDTAPYELSFIVVPKVMKVLTLDYMTTLGNGSNFEKQNTIGDFRWVNEYDKDTNPDKTFGFFRGIMELAAQPLQTEFGWAIMHRRPDPTMLAAPNYSINTGLGSWA